MKDLVSKFGLELWVTGTTEVISRLFILALTASLSLHCSRHQLSSDVNASGTIGDDNRSNAHRQKLESAPDRDTDESKVLKLVNRERAALGLPLLRNDEKLRNLAQDYATDMRNRGYFGHRSPEGEALVERLKRAGIEYSAAAENIAQGLSGADDVMSAWLNSPGHRTNILNPAFRRIGIGKSDQHWVQEFTD